MVFGQESLKRRSVDRFLLVYCTILRSYNIIMVDKCTSPKKNLPVQNKLKLTLAWIIFKEIAVWLSYSLFLKNYDCAHKMLEFPWEIVNLIKRNIKRGKNVRRIIVWFWNHCLWLSKAALKNYWFEKIQKTLMKINYKIINNKW